MRIFDGRTLFELEGGSDEYIRMARPTIEDLAPGPYNFGNVDVEKIVEVERRECGLRDPDHVCVVLDLPLRPSVQGQGLGTFTMGKTGTVRVAVDTETGLVLSSRLKHSYQMTNRTIRVEVESTGRRIRVGAPMGDGIFELPAGNLREVKELTPWGAAGMRKQMVGKHAPEIVARDLEGRPMRLSAMRGRVVVLAFGTTWCKLCQAQRPALEKAYRHHGGKELEIIGLSVSEDRESVEKYLKKSPQTYMGVLTLDNELERQYQVHRFPTYIVSVRANHLAG